MQIETLTPASMPSPGPRLRATLDARRESEATETAGPPAESVMVTPILVVDLPERRVAYRGVDIPTRPPHNLQRQPLLALAVLATHAGQTMPVADLAREMERIGGLGRRLVAPEARDLRYKVLSPFRHALAPASVSRDEIDRLIETVAGVGLRLNAPGAVLVIATRAHAAGGSP
jgi:DNA-binding response OmpR family regulator